MLAPEIAWLLCKQEGIKTTYQGSLCKPGAGKKWVFSRLSTEAFRIFDSCKWFAGQGRIILECLLMISVREKTMQKWQGLRNIADDLDKMQQWSDCYLMKANPWKFKVMFMGKGLNRPENDRDNIGKNL